MSALRKSVLVDTEEISAKQAHVDIIRRINGMKHLSNIKWSTRYIKELQDDTPKAKLDRWACLNIDSDYRAKCCMADINRGYKLQKHKLSKGVWQIKIWYMAVGTKLALYLL